MDRSFTPAWAAGDEAATRFLPRAFLATEGRVAAVHAARERPVTAALLAAIAAQEARRPWSPSRAKNLELLARGAAVVVTGQQVGLFLGPLYTLHKAASAVVTARVLSEESGHPVVPVFWLQTEDHDFEEVRRIALPDHHGVRAYMIDDELAPDARVSLSERALGPSVDALIDSLALPGPHAPAVVSLLARHYRASATFAEAFGGLMAEIFGAHGLVVFDPRAEAERDVLARVCAPIHALALDGASAIEHALSARAEALAAAGFAVQVPVRRGAALSCYAEDTDKPRHRLERADGGGWVTRALSEPIDVGEALAAAPERFTTTALLRPLMQDALLPTAAYVGGPGEIAYLAQLEPLYRLAGMSQPMAIPRARFHLITATARRLAEQLGLDLADAGRPRAELLERLVRGQGALDRIDAAERAVKDAVERGVEALHEEALAHGDRTFGKHADKARGQIAHAFERLHERARRTVLAADGLAAERLDRFLGWLTPDGQPQERVLNFAAFAAADGAPALVEHLVREVRPFDGEPRTVQLP